MNEQKGYKTDWYYIEDTGIIACDATDLIMAKLKEAGLDHFFHEDEFHDVITEVLEKKAIGYRNHN